MSTSDEHRPEADDWTSYDGWREAVVVARRERRLRGESYLARHRRAPHDDANAPDDTQRSA